MEQGISNMTNKKTIIVHDLPADGGGALAILRQFLSEVKTNEIARNYRWIIFVSNGLVDEFSDNHIEIVKVNMRKWHRRIWWDTLGIKRWIRRSLVDPLIAISLASVGFRYLDIPQLVYIHQSLPYGDFKDFKWFEWKARFYTWGIGKWMKWSIKMDSTIVVQTNWMKEAVNRKLGIPFERIIVIRPNVKLLEGNKTKNDKSEFSYRCFYPATAGVSYKNHELLIEVLGEIKSMNSDLFKKLRFVFTCKPEDNRLTKYYEKESKKLDVREAIEWVGYLNNEDMSNEYERADIVLFPSKLETFGLPLVEAASLGKPIIALDRQYAHDVLEGYKGVKYLSNYREEWGKAIISFYENMLSSYDPFIENNSKGWDEFIKLLLGILSKEAW